MLICLGNTSEAICRCLQKLFKQRLGQTLVRFAKQLSFRYLKNVFKKVSLRYIFKMSKQRFSQTLFRLPKQLSSKHLENISGRCLAVLTILLLGILQMSFRPLDLLFIFLCRNSQSARSTSSSFLSISDKGRVGQLKIIAATHSISCGRCKMCRNTEFFLFRIFQYSD